MREDFNRVLTEDPRRGSRSKFAQVRRSKINSIFDGEFSGGKESMMTQRRNQNKQDRKRFGDLLGPLEAWVRKNVGKNWDDLYSEVSRLFDRRSQIKDHVHQHLLNDFVETKTKLIDGEVCIFDRWDGWSPIKNRWRRNFYVHPVTHILCSAEPKDRDPVDKKKAAEELQAIIDSQYRVIDKDNHLYFEDGIWWLFKLADRKPPRIVYRRPTWWYHKEDRDRWDAFTQEEKEAQGQKEYVYDDIAIKAPAVSNVVSRGRYNYGRDMTPAGRYYISKQVAGRKLLKRFNLVGTAEYKEEEGTRSHREMSKYR